MHEVTGHEVEGEKVNVRVLALDLPSIGGACNQYRVERGDGSVMGFLNFHDGPIELNVNDVNGLTMESLIVILQDRLRGFQEGPYSCKQNDLAIKRLDEALRALQARTKERIARDVAGVLAQ